MHYMSTDDQVFGAVKGGAVLAALSDFPFAKKFDVSVVEEKIKQTTPFNSTIMHLATVQTFAGACK